MAKTLVSWIKDRFNRISLYSGLRGISFFASLSDHDLKLIYDSLHKRDFRAGETIFEEGFPHEVIYFVVEGEIQVRGLCFGDGYKSIGANEAVGVIDLFGSGKRLSSAKALTDAKLLALPESDLWELAQKKPSLGVKLLKACCQHLGALIIDFMEEKRGK